MGGRKKGRGDIFKYLEAIVGKLGDMGGEIWEIRIGYKSLWEEK